MGKKVRPTSHRNERLWRVIVVTAIVAAVLCVYWQATRFGFQYYHDDELYVADNPHVTGGLTGASAAWALTAFYAANWHPVTWLSHMLDCQLFGLNAGLHHLTSILLHLLNTVLLLLLLTRLTKSFWKSAFVAALFALHPLHVESVAWISERKDVLSTFFMLATILAYLRFLPRRRPMDYLLMCALFTLGLMSKAMLVTLPLLLILLDYWPLGRLEMSKRGLSAIVREKIPLFVLSAAACAMTYAAQHSGGAVQSLQAYSVTERVANALVAYVEYVWKMLWPTRLAALYPHPVGGWPIWKAAASAALLAAATALAVTERRRRPYLLFGWLWYVVALVPVIGLVQVGGQAFADRYTYVPLIGPFLATAWGAPDLVSKLRSQSYTHLVTSAALGALLLLSVLTFRQVGFWSDSATLFRHAIEVVPRNYLAEHELGAGAVRDGRIEDAVTHIGKAVEFNPGWSLARFNLACVLYWSRDYDEAASQLAIVHRQGFRPDSTESRKLEAEIEKARER